MVITLSPELEAALNDLAHRQGVPMEVLVSGVLRDWVKSLTNGAKPNDQWESLILQAGTNCGVSLPDAALGSEGLYE